MTISVKFHGDKVESSGTGTLEQHQLSTWALVAAEEIATLKAAGATESLAELYEAYCTRAPDVLRDAMEQHFKELKLPGIAFQMLER